MSENRRPRTQVLLRELGIDPNTVAIAGFRTTGYKTFALDAEGKRGYDQVTGKINLEERDWPVGANINLIIDTFLDESPL